MANPPNEAVTPLSFPAAKNQELYFAFGSRPTSQPTTLLASRVTASRPQARKMQDAAAGSRATVLPEEQALAARVTPGSILTHITDPKSLEAYTPADTCALHVLSLTLKEGEAPPRAWPGDRIRPPRAPAAAAGADAEESAAEHAEPRPLSEEESSRLEELGALWDAASSRKHTEGSRLTRRLPAGSLYFQRYGRFGWGVCILLGRVLCRCVAEAEAAPAPA
jgi:hypothetical protein